MKKNGKKAKAVIASLLAVVMSLGMLAGCGGKKDGGGDGVLKMYHFKAGQNTTEDQAKVFEELNKILKEKIGRTIEVEFIDIGAYKEKMQMIYASREEFDMCFNGYLYWTKDAVQQGALMDITELIKEETPALYESIPDWLWKATAVDGKLYSVPNQQIVALGEAINVRKDLAEKYNLDTENVHSYYDLKPFLQQIKENEPDIYPVRGFINETFMTNPLRTAFVNDLIYYYWDDAEFKVCTEEPFYDFAVQANRIYNDGFARPDIATYTDDTADYMAGKYAVMDADDKPGGTSEIQSATGYEWINIRGSQGAGGKDTGTEIGISATSKDPVGALKFIELMNTDKEVYNMFLYGLEGVHYNKVGENRVELIADSGYSFDGQGWRFGNTFNAYLMPGQPDDTWELTKQRNDEAPKSPIVGFNPDTTELQTELAQCLKVKDEYKKRVERGYENPDTYWEEYTKKMEQAGIEKIRAEFNKQLEEFLASQEK